MSRKLRLAEVVAIEKGTREASQAKLTELHHQTSKPALLTGQIRTYTPIKEDDVTFPPEIQRVALTADDVCDQIVKLLTESFDLTARKEYGNCAATADVILDGEVLASAVPATFLLHLDKRLVDLRTVFSKFVTRPVENVWHKDQTPGVWRSDPEKKQRTEKIQDSLVLIQPTEHHPGQAQMIVKDRPVGHWETVKLTGGIEPARQLTILTQLKKLQDAVKVALHAANTAPAPEVEIGAKLLGYVFAPPVPF